MGFEVVDMLARRHGIKVQSGKHRALVGRVMINGEAVVLVKPLTFMTLSGPSVGPLMRDFALTPSQVLVIADDLDLAVGRLRLRLKGSPGGHNGHKSIVASLRTQEYPRLKIGIGRPKDSTIDHVLDSFNREERDIIRIAIEKAATAVERVVELGVERALSAVNEPND